LKNEHSRIRLEAFEWEALVFEVPSSLKHRLRTRAVSTREDAWPH